MMIRNSRWVVPFLLLPLCSGSFSIAQEAAPPQNPPAAVDPAQKPPESAPKPPEPEQKPPEPVPAQVAAPPQQEPPKLPPPVETPPPAAPTGWKDFCCFEKGRMEQDGKVTLVYHWHHHNVPEFARILKEQLPPAPATLVSGSDQASALIITTEKAKVAHVEKVLQGLHHADAPLLIEARVVELRWDREMEIGVEGDLTSGSAIFVKNSGSEAALRDVRVKFNPESAIGGSPFQGSTFRFNSSSSHRGNIGGVIQSFVERGRAQVLSHPYIYVKSGEKATIHAGQEIPAPESLTIQSGTTTIQVKYRKIGVTLEVTPHIASPGQIILKLKPTVSSTLPQLVPISSTFSAPQFTVGEVETEVIVRDGEEVVIGGLVRKSTQEVRRGIPLLSDIPILGYLFGKYEELEVKQEILFFIKPKLVDEPSSLPRQIIDPSQEGK